MGASIHRDHTHCRSDVAHVECCSVRVKLDFPPTQLTLNATDATCPKNATQEHMDTSSTERCVLSVASKEYAVALRWL